MTIETTWTGESFVERLGEVGSGDDDDAFRLLKSVKLDQQLVECLLHVMLVISAPFTRGTAARESHLIFGASLAADSIQLIDKDDCRCLLPSSSKQFPYTLGYERVSYNTFQNGLTDVITSNTNEHLVET